MKKLSFFLIAALCSLFPASMLFADAQSHRKAAEELLKAMDIRQTMISTVDKMVDLEIQNNPQLSKYKGIMRKFFIKYMTNDSLLEDFATFYMEEFTEQELKDITRFYSSPAGRKAIEKLPVMAQKGAQWGRAQVEKNLPELKQMLIEENKRLEKLNKTKK